MNKIISKFLYSSYKEGTFKLLKRLGEENFAILFYSLKNWTLLRTFSIIGYKLPADYIHLLDKEQFDEN